MIIYVGIRITSQLLDLTKNLSLDYLEELDIRLTFIQS